MGFPLPLLPLHLKVLAGECHVSLYFWCTFLHCHSLQALCFLDMPAFVPPHQVAEVRGGIISIFGEHGIGCLGSPHIRL